MSYFDTHQLRRVNWRCSLNITKFLTKENIIRGVFKKESEYVVIWYDHKLTNQNSNTFVEVKFVELTKPTYIGKDGKEYQSFLIVKLPINYLHKIPFGSIWKNAESTQRYQMQSYTVTINSDRDNFAIKSIAKMTYDKVPPLFNLQQYVHVNDLQSFEWDKNQLLNIIQNNITFIMHPLHFFMAHYGYSSEIKRILSIYNWEAISKKLYLNHEIKADCEQPVILPRNLSHRDAIFLYHLKYDSYTQLLVKEMNARMVLGKENGESYKIPCWHNQAITLSFYGIPLDNSVLCLQITGISQPQGDAIDLILAPKNENQKNNVLENSTTTQYRTVKQEREHELEQLDLSLNPVNNLVTANVIEQLKLIGLEREINKIQDTNILQYNLNTKLIPYTKPTDFGVGDKHGSLGNTGIANCFYDVSSNDYIESKSRLERIWEHATQLRVELNANVYWFTPKCQFNENDDFKLVSLNEVCKQLDKKYPLSTLIIRIDIQGQSLIVISFPENNIGSGFSSIVYKPDDIFNFLNSHSYEKNKDTLVKMLVEIVSLGVIDSDYIDSKNGKMATFIHRPGKNNNWVHNGIKKIDLKSN